MRKETLLTATALLLALAAPAGAACLDQVAQLEQRLAQLESGTAGAQQQATATGVQQPQQATTTTGDQQPQQQPAAAAPQQQAAAPQQQQQPATTEQGQATATEQQPIAGDQQQQQPAAAADTQQQPAAEETVEVTLEGGQEVEVTAVPPGGEGQSQDTWLGGTSPQSLQGAQAQLDGARTAAEEGNEAGCMEQVAQAERIINELEAQ